MHGATIQAANLSTLRRREYLVAHWIVLNTCHVRVEEMNAMTVEVSSSTVVVLGRSGVGVASEDLSVTKRNPCIERVSDRRVPQRVRTDASRNARDFGDPFDHSIDVTTIDRFER